MARVTEAEVAVVVQLDEDSAILTSAIGTATLIVDEAITSASVTEARKKQIELFLAAHFSELSAKDGPLAANTMGEATERYHDIYKAGLRATRFGQQAIAIDNSGALATLADQSENPGKKSALFTVIGSPDVEALE